MPVTEESRHRLHQALDTTIGPEEATTLMEHLPPVGWSDVATKQDLTLVRSDITHLEKRFDGLEKRFDSLERRFDSLEAKIAHQSWQVVGLLMAIGLIVIGAAQMVS